MQDPLRKALRDPAIHQRVLEAVPLTAPWLAVSDPISVEDVLRTVLGQMGIDTTKTYYTPLGRPVPIVDGGRVIPGLV